MENKDINVRNVSEDLYKNITMSIDFIINCLL